MPPVPSSSGAGANSSGVEEDSRDDGSDVENTTTTTASSFSPFRFARCCGCSLTHQSPNVAHVLRYTFLDGACYSLWGMQLLPIYLQATTDHSSAIGLGATLSGVAQLVGAFGAGYVADRFSRQLCIRTGGVCAVVALLLLFLAFVLRCVPLIFAGQALWGLYNGITSTSVEALFADSVPQGQRTSIYNVKWIVQTVCYVVGYGTGGALFALSDNRWDTAKVRAILVFGVVVHPFALLPLMWLREAKVVEAPAATGDGTGAATRASAAVSDGSTSDPTVLSAAEAQVGCAAPREHELTPVVSDNALNVLRADLAPCSSRRQLQQQQQQQQQASEPARLPPSELPQRERPEAAADEEVGEDAGEEGALLMNGSYRGERGGDASKCWPQMRWWVRQTCARPDYLISLAMVPYWMCAADFFLAIGAGMSVPFFPIFLTKTHELHPAGMYSLYIATTLLTAATSSLLPWLITAGKLGRIPTVFCVRVAGNIALYLLATAPVGSVLHSLPATIALFACRMALINSVFGITRSVIMDCAARHTRARWSAFESVTSLSWAGSAALGGWITDRHGIGWTFQITAVVQLLATMLMIPAAFGARELERPLPEVASAAARVRVTDEVVEEEDDRV